jgi:type IV secretory pathway VirB10-like protein
VRPAATIVAILLAACAETQPPAPVTTVPTGPETTVPTEPSTPSVPATPAPSPPPAPPTVEAEEARQVAELLSYYQRVAGLGLEDQKRELATATQSFNRDRSNASRVRLALVYAIPGTALQDDARAAQLLEPIASGGGALRQFAGLVHTQVSDRQKTQKRADQLKDQMEQLRAIEKQLLERGTQAPLPRKP